jgi:hypothetical protein
MLMIIGACASISTAVEPEQYRLYEGDPRPADQVAVLLVAPPAEVNAVDGIAVRSNADIFTGDSHRIELLPGEHRVRCAYYARGWAASRDTVTVVFSAKAREAYRLEVWGFGEGPGGPLPGTSVEFRIARDTGRTVNRIVEVVPYPTGATVHASPQRYRVFLVTHVAKLGSRTMIQVSVDAVSGRMARDIAEALNPGYGAVEARSIILDPFSGLINEAFAVAGHTTATDRADCEGAITLLRQILAMGAGKDEGLCHAGIGRCLFRLGRFDEAEKSLESALGLELGSYQREWVELKLGCIADLRHQRDKAIAHYRNANAKPGVSTDGLAERFLKRPYRGGTLDD